MDARKGEIEQPEHFNASHLIGLSALLFKFQTDKSFSLKNDDDFIDIFRTCIREFLPSKESVLKRFYRLKACVEMFPKEIHSCWDELRLMRDIFLAEVNEASSIQMNEICIEKIENIVKVVCEQCSISEDVLKKQMFSYKPFLDQVWYGKFLNISICPLNFCF